MKQTAVEWLVHEFKQKLMGDNLPDWVLGIIEQAKQMEKEQMKYFMQAGYYAHSQGHNKDERLFEYWIKTFKSE